MKALKLKGRMSIAALFVITAVFFLSCENPISLGAKLDLDGPAIDFTAPYPRKSVPMEFVIEGVVSDKSGVDRMILTAELNREPFAKQWRYVRGSWSVSQDAGETWAELEGAAWEGSVYSASWAIPIDMTLNGALPADGEYLFMIQSWDSAGFSDDNSFKTLVLIVDQHPPSVQIVNPYLYDKYSWSSTDNDFTNTDLKALDLIPDTAENETGSRNPANIGKFITRAFDMKWQIDDQHDIWSIDIMFCNYNTTIDGLPETAIEEDKIYYRYHENLGPPPETPDPANNIRPNGSARVPALDNAKGTHPDKDGEILKPVTQKTTLRVVAVCYDAAGNPNEERTLGFFIYWPKADKPWITYQEGMDDPTSYYNQNVSNAMFEKVLMIYPGRSINATAFQAHAVGKVHYTLFKCPETGTAPNTILGTPDFDSKPLTDEVIINEPRIVNGKEVISNNFPWEFTPPTSSGYYVVRAYVYASGEPVYGDEAFTALFRVQDISFPDFPTEPQPNASRPLYEFINAPNGDVNFPATAGAGEIRISGTVSDATQVDSVLMVWINPSSRNYSAMSQLRYFSDPAYAGWELGKNITTPGNYVPENIYDSNNPNKVWKLQLAPLSDDPETNRKRYSYNQIINLASHLDITVGTNPLSSQVFLLKVENPDKKSTIITYAPQGDMSAPVIRIDEVSIDFADPITPDKTGANALKPGVYNLISQFKDGDKITINGSWEEDSATALPVQTYLYPNMVIKVNDTVIPLTDGSGVTVTLTPATGPSASGKGSFVLTATFGASSGSNLLKEGAIRDTLVVSAEIKDIGGNVAEHSASWLIESDTLRLLRISAEELDENRASLSYKAGDTIRIFLEFSKPVTLMSGRSNTPYLILNSQSGTGAKAVYAPNQTEENTKQFFNYTVVANDDTTQLTEKYLNVKGMSVTGVNGGNADTGYNNSTSYPFAWEYHFVDGNTSITEQIRVTNQAGHEPNTTGTPRYAKLPVGNASDSKSLIAGKNIEIDTRPLTVTSITANPTGWHKAGETIQIEVRFNKNVRFNPDTAAPYLTLNTGNTDTGNVRTRNATNPRLNNDSITFTYTVEAGDLRTTNDLRVNATTGYGPANSIMDTPGAVLAQTAFTGNTGVVTGVRLDTTSPGAPTVNIRSGNANLATQPNATLSNLYNDDLTIRITRSGSGDADIAPTGGLQYSINNGASWVTATLDASGQTDVPLNTNGNYQVMARQTDRAGNVSPNSTLRNFNWDKGALVTSINSYTPNGDYTRNAGRQDSISIQVYFRKALIITGTPQITLNVRNGNATTKTINGTNSGGLAVSQLTFTYDVAAGDHTNGEKLTVSAFNLSATDGGAAAVFALPAVADRLQTLKSIYIVTGDLTNTAPTFVNGAGDGIKDDGSYWTTLEIPFNRAIFKGSGIITIAQQAANYRLPAVLTETQYNRFRGVANFDTYYTKGTNGFIVDSSQADTSAKYVMNYQWNPNSAITANNSAFNGDRFIPAAFFNAFRDTETITINVNAQAVSIVNGTTLKIQLSGSNAPQVPGATYTVSYPNTLVTDSFDNVISSAVSYNVTLPGVARPFVRIRKTQDTITAQTGSANDPRLVAAQPFLAYARMDSRTPGSTITYSTGTAETTTNAVNWSTGGNPDDSAAITVTRPNNATANTYNPATPNGQITIGTNDSYQGYQWWARARARTGTNTNNYVWSLDSDEVAFRTVITYRVRGNNANEMAAPGAGTGRQRMGDGDQIWIRGGDAIGSSSVPGFPLTWEDNWSGLQTSAKRAGIRLMTKTGGDTLNNRSVWKFVTWEINTTAYVDFILGHDTTANNTANNNYIWQYGPAQVAYQADGWTAFKDKYPIYPGKHRWCDVGQDLAGKGAINFSGTFSSRPTDLTVTVTQ
jgi:hypothetical protein